MKTTSGHPLVIGTFILTLTGILCRIIGFFYRIYLSRLFGEEGMGLYQLLSPVLALSFSLTAAGYQTAISKLVAEQAARPKTSPLHPLSAGLSISLPLSLLCNMAVYFGADFIAGTLLSEPRTADMLRILSFSIPLSAVHSCVNGYFYGIKKAAIPSASQLLEQLARVGCVFLVSGQSLRAGQTPPISVAVLGLTLGELCSMLFSLAAIRVHDENSRSAAVPQAAEKLPCADAYGRNTFTPRSAVPTASGQLPHTETPFSRPAAAPKTAKKLPCDYAGTPVSRSALYRSLLAMALPLTANRIVLNLLQSVESVSIPSMLRAYGYDTATALSVYGVLTGMALPLIYFPNALTGSVAVLLLPVISENHALGNHRMVRQATVKTVRYCALLGICCMGGFVFFGNLAGRALFDSPLAGYFITTLGFLCPFLYLDTTLSSILQGLGKAGQIFFMNVVCLLLRLAFVFFAVPRFGIRGYLWGLLASQLALGLLYLGCLYRFLRHTPSA